MGQKSSKPEPKIVNTIRNPRASADRRLAFLDGFLHPSLKTDADSLRRGRLQVRFGVLGGFMALVYSVFFFALGHTTLGSVVAVCGFIIMQVPWLVHSSGNLRLTGHIYGAALVIGFSTLCAAGGGLQGFLTGWLAAAPVCALLLMRLREATIWSAISVAAMLGFAVIDLAGGKIPGSFSAEVDAHVCAASQIGLVLFLVFLSLLFEQARIEAFEKLKVANTRLARANADLTDLNRQKNEFLNIAAHDLKNPLSIICGYADLLRELESPTLKEIHYKASEILRSGNHMLDIISNILDVRKIEDGTTRLIRKRCDVNEILDGLVTDYERALTEKGISVNVAHSTDSADAWVDPMATRQVLDNLLSNAIKYTPPGGDVAIRVFSKGAQLVIDVKDSGPGLSREDQSLLWGKFSRLTPRPTGNETSTGLGLWIVRRLTEEMNGSVHCKSALGQGSTFGVQLPLWKCQEESVEVPVETDERRNAHAAFEELIADLEARVRHRGEPIAVPSSGSADLALPS